MLPSVVLQVRETAFTTITGDNADRLDLGYKQIYVFAMRHILSLPNKPSKGVRLIRPIPVVDEFVLKQFACLAYFDSNLKASKRSRVLQLSKPLIVRLTLLVRILSIPAQKSPEGTSQGCRGIAPTSVIEC